MSTLCLRPILSLLAPDEALILEHYQDTRLNTAGEQGLLQAAQTLIRLPETSWLHLSTIDNQPVFILSQKLSPDETIFLSFPATTRISELEAKLTLLNDSLASPVPDPSTALVQELTSTDLKASSSHQPRLDNFLSIFSDLEKSTAKASPTPPNLGDTQPISL